MRLACIFFIEINSLNKAEATFIELLELRLYAFITLFTSCVNTMALSMIYKRLTADE